MTQILTLSTLFKQKSGQKAQQWSVEVRTDDVMRNLNPPAYTLVTIHGQVGGALTTATDIITTGKNAGKANATTPEQQACSEAKAKWEKQRKRGYVETLAEAADGTVSAAISDKAPVAPMLAKVWEDEAHKVVYPAHAQTKFDGHRCLAKIEVELTSAENGLDAEITISLWTRKRERYTSVPHVEAELQRMVETYIGQWDSAEVVEKLRDVGFTITSRDLESLPPKTIHICSLVTDGELYKKGLKFEQLASFVRQQSPKPGYEQVQYHVYDAVSQLPFAKRFAQIEPLFLTESAVRYAETWPVANEAAAIVERDRLVAEGEEGAMLRWGNAGYKCDGRSDGLLKMKRWLRDSAVIVGMEEGRGKLMGCVGALVCHTADKKEFRCKPAMPDAELKAMWEAREGARSVVGKRMQFKYQEKTLDGAPRFPIGESIVAVEVTE